MYDLREDPKSQNDSQGSHRAFSQGDGFAREVARSDFSEVLDH